MPVRSTLLAFAALALVAGCVPDPAIEQSDGRPLGADVFFTRLIVQEDPRFFQVRVAAFGRSLVEVRESARLPATAHCLGRTGNSQVLWDIDPATGDWRVEPLPRGSLIVSGRCAAR